MKRYSNFQQNISYNEFAIIIHISYNECNFLSWMPIQEHYLHGFQGLFKCLLGMNKLIWGTLFWSTDSSSEVCWAQCGRADVSRGRSNSSPRRSRWLVRAFGSHCRSLCTSLLVSLQHKHTLLHVLGCKQENWPKLYWPSKNIWFWLFPSHVLN